MKKNIVFYAIVFFLSTISMAQTITGKFEGPVSSFGKIYLYQHSMIDHKFINVDSAYIKDGQFQFSFKVDEEPSFAYLRLKDQKNDWIWKSSTELFLTADSILLLCEDSLKNMRILNSVTNYDYQRLNEMIAPAKEYANGISQKYTEAAKKIPRDILNTKEHQQFAIKRMRTAREGLYKAYESFITNNPSSWISLYALNRRLLEIGPDYARMKELFSQLDQNIRKSPGGTEIAKRLNNMAKIELGLTAPGFKLPNRQGQIIDLKNYRGKYVLLEFWSSGCGACRLESPHLKTAFSKYRNKGFDILSISLDDAKQFKGKARWLEAIEKDGTGIWQQVSDLTGYRTPAAVKYNVHAIPQNFLIDPNGIIVAKDLRGGDLHNYLEKLFRK